MDPSLFQKKKRNKKKMGIKKGSGQVRSATQSTGEHTGFSPEVSLPSGEQLDEFSGSVRPLLDISVLWRLSGLLHQDESLLHGGVPGPPAETLQVLQQHGELLVWNLTRRRRQRMHPYFVLILCNGETEEGDSVQIMQKNGISSSHTDCWLITW